MLLQVALPLLLAFLSAPLAVHADLERRIVFDVSRALLTARLDPIINPGQISQHAHRIMGASNFNLTYDPDGIRRSQCTNLQPQADMSNYWHPSVHKVIYDAYNGDVTYQPISGRTRIYYNFPTLNPGTGPGTYIEPFPYNFQMVAGTPSKKTGGGYSQEDLSIFYYCEQSYTNGTVNSFTSYSMPMTGCSLLVTKVWFPTCWNGQAFNLANPHGHVQYPQIGQGLLGPVCPLGYERRIPGILLETYYLGANSFADGPYGAWGNNGPDVPSYILANGDTTGYGLHGDFQNGWNTTVLQQVINNCSVVEFNQAMNLACPPLAPSWSQFTADQCLLNSNTTIPDELMGWNTPLSQLPGCNLPWGNDTTKPSCGPEYRDPRLVNWAQLIGPESNPAPSPSDLASPYPAINGTSSNATSTVVAPAVTITRTVISTRTSVSTSILTKFNTTTATTTQSVTRTQSVTTTQSVCPTVSSSVVSSSSSVSASTSPPPSGVWTSGLPSATVVITTASIGGRCGYAAFGTRSICAPTHTCQVSKAGYSTCATTKATSSSSTPLAATTSPPVMMHSTSHTGIWTSGLPEVTVVISTASDSARCGAAFGTRTVCPDSQVCTKVSGNVSSCRASSIPVAVTTKPVMLKPTTASTGVWTSGLPETTVVISTASDSARCGAAFGTRTVCPEAQACTRISGNVSSCRATVTPRIMAAHHRQEPLHKDSKRELAGEQEETAEHDEHPQQTGRRLKRAAEAAEL